MPKCVVVDPDFDWTRRAASASFVPWDHTIIYEIARERLHKTASERAGGAARNLCRARCKEVVEYIKSLGVTSVELLPVHTFINEATLVERV